MAYRILIIEDDPGVRESLALGLGLEGYQILEAPDGKAGLGALQQNPDLVLLDIMMPGLDGYEVTERLKEDPETKDIPIILITALDDTGKLAATQFINVMGGGRKFATFLHGDDITVGFV